MRAKQIVILLGGIGLLAVGYLAIRSCDDGPDSDADSDAADVGAEIPSTGSAPRQAPHPVGPASAPAAAGAETAVRGRILDAQTHAGIADVRVVLSTENGAATGVARTRADGAYELEVPAGRYQVTLHSNTHAVPGKLPALLVRADQSIREADFWLPALCRVEGTVLDARGNPVPNVSVSAQTLVDEIEPSTAGRAELTDSVGRFSVMAAPGKVLMRAEGNALGFAVSPPLYLGSGTVGRGVALQFGANLSLTGYVVSADQRRVNQASVRLKDEFGVRRLPCDEDGRFAASGLTRSPKLLQATARGYSPSQILQVNPDPARPAKAVLTVGVSKRLGGEIVDPHGQTVGGCRVSLRPGTATTMLTHLVSEQELSTSSDGRFLFVDVPQAPVVVIAHCGQGLFASRGGVAPGTLDVKLRLQQPGEVVGRVTDGQSSQPLGDFTVRVVRAAGTGSTFPQGLVARLVQSEGRYELANLPPGTYELAFSAHGHVTTVVQGVVVQASHAAEANVVLDGAGAIKGLVVDSQGHGVPDARVTVDRPMGPPDGFSSTLTDGRGRFSLADVSRGYRTLSVDHPLFHAPQKVSVSVNAGVATDARIELRPLTPSSADIVAIGVSLALRQKSVLVTAVERASAAARAGVRVGDILQEVDGAATSNLGLSGAQKSLAGFVGTVATLTLRRGAATLTVDVVRDRSIVARPAQP